MAQFAEMTVGYDFRGAQEYLNDLNAKMIKDTKELVRGSERDRVKEVLEDGWVGQSQINFMAKLKKASEELCLLLDEMSDAIESMMGAIEEEMIERDKKIVDELGI